MHCGRKTEMRNVVRSQELMLMCTPHHKPVKVNLILIGASYAPIFGLCNAKHSGGMIILVEVFVYMKVLLLGSFALCKRQNHFVWQLFQRA